MGLGTERVILAPFDHPFLGDLLGDPELVPLLAGEVEIQAMVRVEAELALAQAAEGLIPADAALAIQAVCGSFRADLGALRAATARDGVPVPELIGQLRAALGEPFGRWLHIGATSQDLVDTSLILRLRSAAALLDARLDAIAKTLDALAGRWGQRSLMGRTRWRRARPIRWADKLAAWREPLLRHRQRLVQLAPRLFRLQLGGAVGDRAELGPRGQAIADRLADSLGLGRAERARHAERDGIAELAGWLALIAGSLGKLGQDVAILAQDEVAEIHLEGGGRSSAMPHKSNPVAAEVLVALARYAAVQVSALHQALVHEGERSGAAWTLEWLTLPPLVMTAGASTRQALRLLGQLRLPEPSAAAPG